MKKPVDSLFQFIKTMSGHEKRYFKINSSLYADKLTLLFDAIDAQKIYDEAAIRKKFKSDNYLDKNISKAKLNLQSSLLNCLRNYYPSTNIDFALRNLIADLDILIHKGLYNMCHKSIKRIKNLAAKHEYWTTQYETIQYERYLIRIKGFDEITYRTWGHLEKEEQEAFKKTKNDSAYRYLLDQIDFLLLLKGDGNKNINELKQLFNHPLLSDEKKALSKKAKIRFHHIKYLYFIHISENLNKAYQHGKTSLMVIKQFPLTDENTMTYIASVYRCVKVCNMLNKWGDALLLIQEIKKILNKSFSERSVNVSKMAFAFAFGGELEIYNRIGKFEEAVLLIPEIEGGLMRYSSYLSGEDRLVFYYGIAYSYFGKADYRNALKWLNKLLNEANISVRPDVNCLARIMYLLVHVELGNDELLQSIIKSTYRFLHKRSHVYKFEELILQFIRKKLPFNNNRGQLLDAFKELHSKLKKIITDPFENKAMEGFNLISWLESKIEKKSFSEIVKKKTQ